jgi:hypothetical protein
LSYGTITGGFEGFLGLDGVENVPIFVTYPAMDYLIINDARLIPVAVGVVMGLDAGDFGIFF